MLNKLYWWFLAVVTGTAGGLMLTVGHFYEPLVLLQGIAFVPLLFLLYKQTKFSYAIIAGIFTGLAFSLPQVITLHLPVWMAAALTTEITLLLTVLCMAACWSVKKGTSLSCLVFGAAWCLLDWLNSTAIPIWGMAQSFARNWTAYPYLIGFISLTGVSGILFFIGTLQALFIRLCMNKQNRTNTFLSLGAMVVVIAMLDSLPFLQKPSGTLRVAAAGWTSRDSLGGFYNPDQKKEEFKKLYAQPAAKAASQGAKLFASGEMAFQFNDSEKTEWINKFSSVARENNLYLIVGYRSSQGNRLFFMNPQGEIVADYLKTHLSPPEWGNIHGNGDLKTIEVDGVKIGAMICHDDNFSHLTRYYGRLKTPVIVTPSWDWSEVKDAHLAAVRARAIECHYAIARANYHGIAAIIGPNGEILARHDTFEEGPGFVIADVPLYNDITPFARFGHTPMICFAAIILLLSRKSR
jgi:apolipoprotein N-acyltransferase